MDRLWYEINIPIFSKEKIGYNYHNDSLCFFRYLITPLGVRLGVKDKKQVLASSHPVLEKFYKKNGFVNNNSIEVGHGPSLIFYLRNYTRVPTRSGNHGKPGKSLKEVPCMEKSSILKKPE